MQFREKLSDTQNSQLYRLNTEPGTDSHSTFCISERYIATLNSLKFFADIHAPCSQPLLSYSIYLLLQYNQPFNVISDSFQNNYEWFGKSCQQLIFVTLFPLLWLYCHFGWRISSNFISIFNNWVRYANFLFMKPCGSYTEPI